MDINVTITASKPLEALLGRLCSAIEQPKAPSIEEQAARQRVVPMAQKNLASPTQPIRPVPVVQTAPIARTPTAPTAAPVAAQAAPAPVAAAPAYTTDDLAHAATALMDSGKLQQLQALLQQFGVPALTVLPKEKYGEFATALRGMGARI